MSNDVKWNKPSAGLFKCNIDTSFSNNKVGICVCIRDDEGLFVASRSKWFLPSTEVDVGEALGLLTSIKWVHELRLDSVDFELDAKSVVENLNIQQPNDLDFGAITLECNRLLALLLRNSHVMFVRRQVNEVAHVLTWTTPSIASFQILSMYMLALNSDAHFKS